MKAFGWTVLALLFLVEAAALGSFGVWGSAHSPQELLVWLLPLAGIVVWGLFASPKAQFGGHGVRPAVKVLVFGLAALALADAGYPWWAGGGSAIVPRPRRAPRGQGAPGGLAAPQTRVLAKICQASTLLALRLSQM